MTRATSESFAFSDLPPLVQLLIAASTTLSCRIEYAGRARRRLRGCAAQPAKRPASQANEIVLADLRLACAVHDASSLSDLPPNSFTTIWASILCLLRKVCTGRAWTWWGVEALGLKTAEPFFNDNSNFHQTFWDFKQRW